MTPLLNQARAHADAGEINAARTLYAKVIEIERNNPDLLEELGFLEVQAGHFTEAVNLMKLALSFRPNDPTSHLNLAEAYSLSGEKDSAKLHYEKVIEISPSDPDAHFGLAKLALYTEQWELARDHLKTAHALSPNDIEILHLTASTLIQTEDWRDAEGAYLKIIKLHPGHLQAITDLARFYYDRHKYPSAIKYYNIAEEIAPLPTDDLLNLSQALIGDGRAKEAIAVTHKLMMSSNLPDVALIRRGELLSTLGMFDEAERDFRSALRVNRRTTSAYEQLGYIHRLKDKDLRYLEKIVEGSTLKKEALINAWFALSNGYKAEKSYEKSFTALKNACDLYLKDNPIDLDSIRESPQKVRDVFTRQFFEQTRDFGYKKTGPIFIVGMPRSGTTLTERVLAAHPQIIGLGERYNITNLANDIEGYPESLLDVSNEWAVEHGKLLHRDYLPEDREEGFAADKMPGNYLMVGLISLILPNAKIIWCKRNPIDNCLSCYQQHFLTGWNFTYSLEGLGIAYRQHEKIMHHWMDVCPIPVHTVEYEQMVAEPEKTARDMLEYVGVDWDPRCLNPEQVENNIVTASMWQARQPIYKGSVEKWRKYEKQLQPLIKALEEN